MRAGLYLSWWPIFCHGYAFVDNREVSLFHIGSDFVLPSSDYITLEVIGFFLLAMQKIHYYNVTTIIQ
jgi:hypothetical protein